MNVSHESHQIESSAKLSIYPKIFLTCPFMYAVYLRMFDIPRPVLALVR